ARFDRLDDDDATYGADHGGGRDNFYRRHLAWLHEHPGAAAYPSRARLWHSENSAAKRARSAGPPRVPEWAGRGTADVVRAATISVMADGSDISSPVAAAVSATSSSSSPASADVATVGHLTYATLPPDGVLVHESLPG